MRDAKYLWGHPALTMIERELVCKDNAVMRLMRIVITMFKLTKLPLLLLFPREAYDMLKQIMDVEWMKAEDIDPEVFDSEFKGAPRLTLLSSWDISGSLRMGARTTLTIERVSGTGVPKAGRRFSELIENIICFEMQRDMNAAI